MQRHHYYLSLFSLWVFLSCERPVKKRQFEKVDAKFSGITFINELTDSPEINILTYLYYYNGGGIAAGDFNDDGLTDLYFTANQKPDQLYLNQGGLQFKEIGEISQITNDTGWTTGATSADINGDGLLDIYVCKVGNYKSFKGKNLLYLNLGNDEQGIPKFREAAKEFGLDFSGFSTQASFFDYDLDGDLDMYLLNHSVHPNRTYGMGSQRSTIDSLAGDRLYQNVEGNFFDVTKGSNIFQGRIGYGLGIGTSDLNNDGYPDLYIGNDFFENDYLYINQKDGTFKEIISADNTKLGHTTHFSMGNDIADINNDGFTDIVSLDMLPKDLRTYKTSGLEYPFPNYVYYLKNGYAPQYMQNTLHVNLGNEYFSEIGNLSGISASEWSWSALIADYDNDGFKDLFVSNGIKGASNDMDFINYIVNDSIQKRIQNGMEKEDLAFLRKMPEKKVPNFIFKNNGDLTFSDVSADWMIQEPTFSNGAIYDDLDNDGDLDIVVNNVNESAHLLENKNQKNNFLKIKFKGPEGNRFGIGSKVIVYSKNNVIVQENFVTRGYLSSIAPELFIGMGQDSIADSLEVFWPTGEKQLLKSLKANNTIVLNHIDSKVVPENLKSKATYFTLSKIDSILDFKHKEQPTIEFNRNPLVPFTHTNEGPDISIADINSDGTDDIFISGAKNQPSELFLQDKNGDFKIAQTSVFETDAINEDVGHVFFDGDNDGDLDLVVVSAGNEFKNGPPLRPRLYTNINGEFKKEVEAFNEITTNASKVLSVDFDNDGDQDLSIFSDQVPWEFGITPRQWLLENDGNGNFTDITPWFANDLLEIGNVKDANWVDLDNNGYKDLILVGHWMPIQIFMNSGTKLVKIENNGLKDTNGWWNTIEAKDLDNDGDIDFAVGNWGTNTKFRASKDKPIRLYSADYDSNGTLDPIITYYHGEKETPFASRDELAKQLPFLNKKYLQYKDFANASVEKLFGAEKLDNADQKKVFELRSAIFINDGNASFSIKYLPFMAQSSTVRDMLTYDFNKDGLYDLFLVGNDYQISTQLGRLDASHGLILLNKGNGNFEWQPFSEPISGAARSINEITINHKPHIIVGMNDEEPIILKMENE